jgi:hypothetical protein
MFEQQTIEERLVFVLQLPQIDVFIEIGFLRLKRFLCPRHLFIQRLHVGRE